MKSNYRFKKSFVHLFRSKKSIRYFLFSIMIVLMINWSALYATSATENPVDSELGAVLAKTADYCEKMKDAVFHFFCREKLHETVEKQVVYPNEKEGLKNFLEGRKEREERSRYSAINDLKQRRKEDSYSNKKKSISHSYVNDYQIIKQNSIVKEQRILINVNGKKVEKKKSGNNTFLYSFKNALTPIYLFSRENQIKYNYCILGQEKIMGRPALMLEVMLKDNKALPGDEEKKDMDKLAIAWVDSQDFSIIKIKVMPGAIKGYYQLLDAGEKKWLDLDVSDIHWFGYSRQGIRYPTKTEIVLSYSQEPQSHIRRTRGDISRVNVGGVAKTKISTNIFYDKYMFFDVTVDEPVFKDME